jgi:hypothetical protein
MEEQIATSQPSMYMPEAVIKTAATATDILALKDARVGQLSDLRKDIMSRIEEIDAELKQLGTIGMPTKISAGWTDDPKYAMTAAEAASLPDLTKPNGKRGRGRPPGVKNKTKAK